MPETIKLYNTLTRKKEAFKPIKKGQVGMYSCGPTVYNRAHIGNLRTTIFNDILKRVFLHNNFKVNHVMNITDVDDKTIKASQQAKTSLKDFTRKYEGIFFSDTNELNVIKPSVILRATENIEEMIKIIKKLMKKGYAYKTSDGIYYSIKKFKSYGKLANLQKIKSSKSRILQDEYDKSNAQDFALWKFYTNEDGSVFWETNIGKGRPGWHIECSAMSMKILGEHFDIHTGGQDLIFPHHTNEIAQSQAATGKKFANYWLHSGMLTMKEGKMSKSLGNIFTLEDIKKDYNPLHFRYLCLLTYYRKPLNFTLENLDAAKNAYERLKRKIIELKKEEHKGEDNAKLYHSKFHKAINDDINIPKALQIFLEALDDFDFNPKKKLELLEHFDSVLGLNIKDMHETTLIIPKDVQALIDSRERLRKNKLWAEADIIRERIKEKGYLISDTSQGPKIEKV